MTFKDCSWVQRRAIGTAIVLAFTAGAVPCGAQGTVTGTLAMVVRQMPGANQATVTAQAKIDGVQGPQYPNLPQAVPYHETFSGDFSVPDGITGLAIHSDDGSRVTVTGPGIDTPRIYDWLDHGQALPEIASSLHFLDVVLVPGQTYHIQVDYSNICYAGNLDIDGCTLFAYNAELALAKPDPLTNFTATAVSTSQINLAWTAEKAESLTFGITRTDGDGTVTQLPLVIGLTSFHDTTCIPGMRYSYTLVASNEIGSSSPAGPAVATTLLDVPTGLAATPGDGEIDIRWNPVTGAGGYSLWRNDQDHPTAICVGGGMAAETTAIDMAADPGVTYSYTVVAYTDFTQSPSSAPASATLPDNGPYNLAVSQPTMSSLHLTWSFDGLDGLGFTVQRYEYGAYQTIATVGAGTLSYADSGLALGTKYTYVCAPLCKVGLALLSPARRRQG